METILQAGSQALGVPLEAGQISALRGYAKLLQEWNEKMNLTAITDDAGIATKHFLDSLTALCTGKVRGKVIDVGTGAGFPGLVLKIARPELQLTLLDSLQKRLRFLETVCQALDIPGVTFVHARAEDGARRLGPQFDTVVSRAVANLTVLSELCIPFLKVGGYFLALKGPQADEEIQAADRAIRILGGRLESVFQAAIPGTDLAHKIIIIKKVRQTPRQYPRKAGIPAKIPFDSCYNLKKNAK